MESLHVSISAHYIVDVYIEQIYLVKLGLVHQVRLPSSVTHQFFAQLALLSHRVFELV